MSSDGVRSMMPGQLAKNRGPYRAHLGQCSPGWDEIPTKIFDVKFL